jgi:hypothetical protein
MVGDATPVNQKFLPGKRLSRDTDFGKSARIDL